MIKGINDIRNNLKSLKDLQGNLSNIDMSNPEKMLESMGIDMEQLNKVVEQIIFFQGRSFGDRFKFQIKGDGYNFETMQDTNDDRIVRATVNLVTKAYIVPEYTGIKNNNRRG